MQLSETSQEKKTSPPKPFIKWAGGKSQLLPEIEKRLPSNFNNKIHTYVEPFSGSAAVLYRIFNLNPGIKRAVINDSNHDLINVYHCIKYKLGEISEVLLKLSNEYFSFKLEEECKAFFLEQRELFNQRQSSSPHQAALFIFLNKTCFNGLYRVNQKNQFNVPFGRYKNPRIFDYQNLEKAHQVFQKVDIMMGDFEETDKYSGPGSFYYFDPPYKPISETSSFNSYTQGLFDDASQIRLKNFCDRLTDNKSQWLLSNSDPKNTQSENEFFDDLYSDYTIERVKARRSINSKANGRGEIHELLIRNY
ncbi:MAG: DNA adenine methylase [Bacteroidales bacterium]|nr:DNA adenine methylase [Bacteroidales bacterium]